MQIIFTAHVNENGLAATDSLLAYSPKALKSYEHKNTGGHTQPICVAPTINSK